MNHVLKILSNPMNSRDLYKFLGLLAGLNLIWEIGQLPLYTLWHSGSWTKITFSIAHCTLGDFLIALTCAILSLAVTGWNWPESRQHNAIFLFSFITFGLIYTVFSEWLNATVRMSWTYSNLMPIIPPLGTGVAPLLQWIALPLLGFWFTAGASKSGRATK